MIYLNHGATFISDDLVKPNQGHIKPKPNPVLVVDSPLSCPDIDISRGRFYEVRLRKLAQTSGARHRVEWNQAAEEIGRDKQGIRRQRRGRGETGRERKE